MTARSRLPKLVSYAVILVVAVGCASVTGRDEAEETPSVPEETPSVPEEATAGADEEPADTSAETAVAADGVLAVLPVREGPREETTQDVPHIQIDAEPVPEVDAELRRRAFSLPGVENRPSELSLPGARGLWLADDVELARPEVFLAGREFAHIHPDGSLHVWLPFDRAAEVDETKWGEFHPWVGRDGFWNGVVMVYTPETLAELEITIQLVVDAYNLVTGADIDPAAFP